jgi:hypothetical protein
MPKVEKIKQRPIKANESFHTLVAGVNKKNEDGSSRQQIIRDYVGVGHSLELKREPNNTKDKYTVSVWWANYQIGYLGSYLSEGVCRELDAGNPVSAVVTEVDTEDEESRTYNVYFELSTGEIAKKIILTDQERSKSTKRNFNIFYLVVIGSTILLITWCILILNK